MLHLSLIVAPDADFAIYVGANILQVLHLALPQGRVSPSGSSSRMSGLSFYIYMCGCVCGVGGWV